jgi:hypothetical protein
MLNFDLKYGLPLLSFGKFGRLEHSLYIFHFLIAKKTLLTCKFIISFVDELSRWSGVSCTTADVKACKKAQPKTTKLSLAIFKLTKYRNIHCPSINFVS